MIKIFKQSNYLRVRDGYWRMFIRWAYHKYLDELYIPRGTTYRIGHGYEDISAKYNGYGKHIQISTPQHYKNSIFRHGNQEILLYL